MQHMVACKRSGPLTAWEILSTDMYTHAPRVNAASRAACCGGMAQALQNMMEAQKGLAGNAASPGNHGRIGTFPKALQSREANAGSDGEPLWQSGSALSCLLYIFAALGRALSAQQNLVYKIGAAG